MNSPSENLPAGSTCSDAELERLRAGARLTFREKLRWIEEAGYIAETLARVSLPYRDGNGNTRWLIAENRDAYQAVLKNLHP